MTSKVVFPGETITLPAGSSIKVGPGIQERNGSVLVASKAGKLLKGKGIYVDNYQKRVFTSKSSSINLITQYIPSVGDLVVGIISAKSSENYKVDIGGPHPATLSVLAFEGATKRNRLHLEVRRLE